MKLIRMLRHRARFGLGTLLIAVVCFALAFNFWAQRRNEFIRRYREGFVDGALFASKEGDSGGIMCGDGDAWNQGFDAGRILVGSEISQNPESYMRSRNVAVLDFLKQRVDVNEATLNAIHNKMAARPSRAK